MANIIIVSGEASEALSLKSRKSSGFLPAPVPFPAVLQITANSIQQGKEIRVVSQGGNSLSQEFLPALLPVFERSEAITSWLVIGWSVAFTCSSAGQLAPCWAPAGGLGGAHLDGGPPCHLDQSLLIFINLYTVCWLNNYSVLLKSLNSIEAKLSEITQEPDMFLMHGPHLRLCEKVVAGPMLAVGLLRSTASVRCLARNRKMRPGQPLPSQTLWPTTENPSKWVITVLPPSAVTVQETVLPPRRKLTSRQIRGKLPDVIKGSSSKAREAWSHSICSWVF